MFFPDVQHVDAIRRALWSGGALGRAAVMVGAGMSRNAVCLRAGRNEMPTWWHLVDAMIDRLYPADSGHDHRRNGLKNQAGATSTALRLADEFAAAFGRSALDELILEQMPDSDFAPGPLHQLLIELPWVDVLTTNYDTLLERAAACTFGRRYSIVHTPAELPGSGRPRIVKLHGSFPSTRPFVFSEEDFRTYPDRSAAFVNLARQTVLENVLCLIGFSGDDPNFLAWTGWVRDHLADHAPRIYLCGLLDLTNSQRSVLQARGVVPIDLTPVFPADSYADRGQRHRTALEWFLLNLRNGRPYEPMEWPNPPKVRSVIAGQMSPLTSSRPDPVAETWWPSDHPTEPNAVKSPAEQLLAVATEWRHNRGLYPGWLIAPQSVRELLLLRGLDPHKWCGYFAEHYATLRPLQQLEVLHELNWRLETALLPVWDHLLPAYEAVLAAINPFTRNETNSPLTHETDLAPEADWQTIREQWLAIACGLLRYYREERKWVEFVVWTDRLSKISYAPADIRARWCYERYLAAVAQLDDVKAHIALRDWPTETRDHFWAVRRAGMLAELGQTVEAIRIVEDALRAIRHGLEDADSHIPALSREGWAMWLHRGLRRAENSRRMVYEGDDVARAEIRRRYRDLQPFGANPEDLAAGLRMRLDGHVPIADPPIKVRIGFELNRRSRTVSWGNGLFEKIVPAYQYMRLSEESGIPPSVGSSTFTKSPLARAAEWFRDHDPVRTQSLLFRLMEETVTDGYLSRHRIAALPTDIVDRWRLDARHAIQAGISLTGRDFRDSSDIERRSRDRIKTAAVVLSRTLLRALPDELAALWDLTLGLYKSNFCRLGVGGDGVLKALLNNWLEVSPPELLAARFRSLCDLPLPNEPGFEVRLPDSWPDIVIEVGNALLSLGRRPDGMEWGLVVDRLVGLLKSGAPHVSQGAMWRLHILKLHGLLEPVHVRKAAAFFWGSEKRSDSLPVVQFGQGTIGLALSWPTSSGLSAANRVKRHLLDHKLSEVHGFGNVNLWFDQLHYVAPPAGLRPDTRESVTWSNADANRLFAIILTWWDAHGKQHAEQARTGRSDWMSDPSDLYGFVHGLCDVIRMVLLPLVTSRSPLLTKILDLIHEMQEAELPVAAVLPAILRHRPAAHDDVTSALRREFADHRHEFRLSALRGIVYWADAHRPGRAKNSVPPLPLDLLRELGAAVAQRRPGSLSDVLDGSIAVLRRFGISADGQFLDSVIVGLDSLFKETAYRLKDVPDAAISYDEVPLIRLQCARLAKEVANCGRAENRIIKQWLDAAAKDSLPEVRAAVADSV